MDDQAKTREELIAELNQLRKRMAGLEAGETRSKWVEETFLAAEAGLHNVPEVLLLTDTEGTIQQWTCRAQQLFGYTAFEAVGCPFHFLFTPKVRETAIANFVQAIQEVGEFFDAVPCLCKDGSEIQAQIVARKLYNQQNNVVGLAILKRDLAGQHRLRKSLGTYCRGLEQQIAKQTGELQDSFRFLKQEVAARREAEVTLRESEAKYRNLVEQNLDGIYIIQDGKFIFANQQFLDMLGHTREELQAINPWDTIAPESLELLKKRWQKRQRKESIHDQYEMTIIRKDGSLLPTEVHVHQISYHNKKAFQGCIRDITERKHIEERVQEQDRLAAVGQMAAGIAHDFNNILTVMNGTAQLLWMKPDTPEEYKQDLEMIYSQGERAAQLVRQVLDFSRKTVVQRKPIELTPFLKEAIKMLERTIPETIRIETAFDSSSYVIKTNPTQLQQILTNLAVNAKDAMPEGGELNIELSQLELTPDDIPPVPEMPPGKWVVWTIADTGTGMAPEVREHIFEPFFTTKPRYEGTGLGLAQVYGIVKQHEGFIDVESEEGKGTTFRIYLPGYDAKEQATDKETGAALGGKGETILVVEDELSVLRIAERMIKDLNYHVLTATNGQEALERYECNRDEIALVLTDMMMPEMTGAALFDALKERDPDVRVVIMTGYSAGEKGVPRLPENIAGYLEKPLAMKNMAEVISKTLAEV